MSINFTSGNIEFAFRTSKSAAPGQPSDDTPFCLAVLGDFSGRSNRGLCETGATLAARRPIIVDVDNFDRLPGKLGAEIHIPVGSEEGSRIAISFAELDDFHPDSLFDKIDMFQKLKSLRRRLQDTSTFAEAAEEVRLRYADQAATDQATADGTGKVQAEAKPDKKSEADADTIERLLGKPATAKQPTHIAGKIADVDALIRDAVKPYIVPGPDPQQDELVGQIDRAISGQMRGILHHPDFQQIEAAWRTLHFLVSNIETDETLKLYVIDISREELAADLAEAESLSQSGVYRLLVEQSVSVPGGDPWAVLLGCYSFDQTAEDITLLQKLAGVAHAAGAPFLTAAHPHFADCESFAATPDPDNWQWQPEAATAQKWYELRTSPDAASLGLALPRFLLRLPYERDGESVERFDFEELPDKTAYEKYLWGNSAALCTYLLAQAFRVSGWSLTNALQTEVTGLPMYVYESVGEKQIVPCAVSYLTERAMQRLIGNGLIPMLSVKGRDSVLIPRFQSVGEPPSPLAGRWQ
jgi:type VI secretion system protein ImpC